MHEIEADQAGECQAVFHGVLGFVCSAQDQVGDQSDEDLDGDCVVRFAEEPFDLRDELMDFDREEGGEV